MANHISRGASYVCRSCRAQQCSITTRSLFVHSSRIKQNQTQPQWSQSRAASTRTPPRLPHQAVRKPKTPPRTGQPSQPSADSVQQPPPPIASTQYANINTSEPSRALRDIRREANSLSASRDIPEQAKVLEVLDQAYQFANLLLFGQTTAPDEQSVSEDNNADTSLISDLEESVGAASNTKTINPEPMNLPISHREKLAADTCQIIYDLLKDPKIAIDEAILSIYVRIVCQLGRPEYLPEIFFLYANKPIPIQDKQQIQFKSTSPNTPKNAIPQNLSDVALDTAILQRDLPLAIAIIDTTVATRAFRTNKFLRKASLPLGFAASTPLAVYAAADWVANWQNTLDPQMAKAMTIMGATAYVGTLGTIGFVALTTYNDHHDRVVWIPGTPLRQRWLREEERLYFDRIAMAWGFQRRGRRGEEMGQEWEALREELAVRSMVLDKSDLLEGMQ